MHPVPVMGSCLGHIPGEAMDKLSLWPWGVTWTATSTGWRPRRPGVTRSRGARHEGVVGGDEDVVDDGGGLLPRSLSWQRRPWHCLRLCSINSRMSDRGNRAWHCPQVRRSGSPLGKEVGATGSRRESSWGSSGRSAVTGSAAQDHG